MKEEREFISKQMDEKFELQEEDTCYLPAEMTDGILRSGIMVRDGTLVNADTDTNMGTVQPASHSEEVVVQQNEENVKADAEDLVVRERDEVVLVDDAERPSVLGEAGGDQV